MARSLDSWETSGSSPKNERCRKVTGERSESHWGKVGKSLGGGRKVTREGSQSHQGIVGKSPNIYAHIYAHFFSRMTALLHMPLKIDFEGQGGTEP